VGRWAAPLAAMVAVAFVLAGCGTGAPAARDRAAAPTQAPELAAPAGGGDVAAIPADVVPSPTAAPPPRPTETPVPIVAAATATPVAPAAATDEPDPTGPRPTPRPAPPPDPGTGLSQVVEGGTNGREQVAFTFDAGADTGYAAAILDLLRDEGIKASFGMTGKWAEANPDLVKRMVAEGHQLINHTWSHSSIIGVGSGTEPMTYETLLDELRRTEQVVEDLTGYDMKPFFRAPYGEWDDTRLAYLADAGYYINVYWTCDTRGWAGWDAGKITGYCTTNIKPHEIILLHVGAGAPGDYESLPAMIAFFRAEGYEFVTVEQMLQP
jgi:peptidoglycan/xylan/chitin deacetylase (PgdA/CDA1 family)